MSVTDPTWSVVATVDEPPALLQAFVAWHLSLGASEVFVYFDRPDDPAISLFAGQPQVVVARCDEAHWLRLDRRRPFKQEVRQARNATLAYRQTRSDWLLHIDADEFLWPSQSVADCLAGAADTADCLTVPVAERMFVAGSESESIFSGVFRRPFSSDMNDGSAVFGIRNGPTLRGLTGHTIGKAFSRCGRGLDISIHRPRPEQGSEAELISARAQGLELLHFEGLTPLHWIYKLVRMAKVIAFHNGLVAPPHRQQQMESVLADPKGATELHDLLKVADMALLDALDNHGLVLRAGFDPADAMRTCFAGALPDLSADALDAWLWAERGELLHRRGFSWLRSS
ncbi:glycosyltransferase family 2 protein [Yoonia sp. R2-816]|uniref:glycosyltransferase family 2 protein n=1 Tax=Yoonia sp. R2-816 TaxID=3342638 RepID=UPI00372BB90B